jgi:outer membrane receptor for Fe3+-dicitrate
MKKLLLIQKRGKSLSGKTLPFIFFYLFVASNIRAQILQGKVTDNKNEAVVGASVLVKGAQKGTVTNAEGNFSIKAEKDDKLIISSVGFKKQEVNVSGRNSLNIVLIEDIESLEEVIVTGVFDKRTRMESSVAISVLNSKQLSSIIPNSAADLLKNIPGVFVNSSLGEIRNTVYSRGVSVGSNDGASGYYYVSMQEDGLPVTNATFSNYA